MFHTINKCLYIIIRYTMAKEREMMSDANTIFCGGAHGWNGKVK